LGPVTLAALSSVGLPDQINYVGGGSGAGEMAMISSSQHVAPMSRELNDGIPESFPDPSAPPLQKCLPSAQELLIGLDAVVVVTANPAGGDSLDLTGPTLGPDDCSDSISGGKALSVPGCTSTDGCEPVGRHTCNMQFTSMELISCLVRANSCTIGFGGPQMITGDDFFLAPPPVALRMEGVTASEQNIKNLLLSPAASYPLSHGLWLSSIVGFGDPSLTPVEQALFSAESDPATIDPIVGSHGFVMVPPGVNRLGPCPHP
jgi:hypothetical protein